MGSVCARSVGGIGEVRAGDDLAALLVAALDPERLSDDLVVAVAHTAVSKAEGATRALADVRPSECAVTLAHDSHPPRDPRVVQVVLDESSEVLRAARGVLICRTRHGFVCANAGVDASNAGSDASNASSDASNASSDASSAGGARESETVVLLPRDPDASARKIRARIRALSGASPAVLITDSFGRAWRHGQCDVCIGLAGMAPLDDWRGRTDASGLVLRATWLAVADAAAGAADLARAKDSREPVVLIDGLARFITGEDGPGAAALLRPVDEDLFG